MIESYEAISVRLEKQKRKMNNLRVASVLIVLLTAGLGAVIQNMILFGVGLVAFVIMLFGLGIPTMRKISVLKKQLNQLSSK